MELTIDQINKKISDCERVMILDKSDIVQTVYSLSKSFNKTIDNIKSKVINHMLRFVLQYKDWNYVINNKYDFDIFVDSVWEKIWTRQDILKLQKIAFQLV